MQFYGANRTGRWAGRLIQVHTLPRNYLSDLKEARDLIKAGCADVLEMLYGLLPDTLSQLIRTAFIPSVGARFIVALWWDIEAAAMQAMRELEAAGYKIVMHVHDEVICDQPQGQGSVEEACQIMSKAPVWVAGLPLAAEGFECSFYKKD